MASVINTNVASLNAQRNLAKTQSGLEVSLQRLSTGMRINSAKDDAAGMAIASRMSAQINGLNQAARNANDGISLSQTAEGGLQGAADLLQRMRTLAVQSSNSTNSASDRASMQAEVAQLKEEIDRIAGSTAFNGINLLDGTFTAQTFQVGANSGASDRIQLNALTNLKTNTLGGGGVTGSATLTTGMTNGADLKTMAAGDLTLNGIQIGATTSGGEAGQTSNSAWAVAQAINLKGSESGVTATANATVASTIWTSTTAVAGTKDVSAGSFSINGVSIGEIKKGVTADGTTVPPTAGGKTSAADFGAHLAAAINSVSSQTHVTAFSDDSGNVTIESLDGKGISIKELGSYTGLTTDTGLSADAGTATLAVDVNTSSQAPTASATGYQADSIRINGISVGFIAGAADAKGQGANVAAAINLVEGKTGVHAIADANTGALVLTAADGRNITLDNGPGDGGAGSTGTTEAILGLSGVTTHTGMGAGNSGTSGVYSATVTLSSTNTNGIVVGGANTKYAGLGGAGIVKADTTSSANTISAVDISTTAGALSALAAIDSALAQVDQARGKMGAIQNRFTSVVSNVQLTSENLSAARSRIQDTDFAAETTALSRSQILQQAGTAMLAQANSLPNAVLSLLK